MTIFLFAEDQLCLALGEAVLKVGFPDVSPVLRVSGGYGRIKVDVAKYAAMAVRNRVVVVVDLDSGCPVSRLTDWGVPSLPDSLAFRFAVHECESWLLADHEGASGFFGISAGKLPDDPDGLPDPKGTFLALMRRYSRGKRAVREDVLPPDGSLSRVGLGYNLQTSLFVRSSWSMDRARKRSPSLDRAIRACDRMRG